MLNSYESSASAAVNRADALAIYEAVLKIKPGYILELGPGTSTVVICRAISRIRSEDPSYQPIFVAVEEDRKWLSFHEDNFPSELSSMVEMIHRETDCKDVDGVRVAYYKNIPVHPYEFIHIDGPDFLKFGASVSSDLVDLSLELGSSCYVIFDSREDTARYAIEHTDFDAKRNLGTLNYELYK